MGEKMSRQEAGRKGGVATRDRHGAEHYKAIGAAGGRKGGQATARLYGPEHYREIGRRGGAAGKGRRSR